MMYTFECDNCSAKIKTACGDGKSYTYYSPVVPKAKQAKDIYTVNDLKEYIMLSAKSAMTTLCDKCTSQ